jgi:hypothetical protein
LAGESFAVITFLRLPFDPLMLVLIEIGLLPIGCIGGADGAGAGTNIPGLRFAIPFVTDGGGVSAISSTKFFKI